MTRRRVGNETHTQKKVKKKEKETVKIKILQSSSTINNLSESRKSRRHYQSKWGTIFKYREDREAESKTKKEFGFCRACV